MSTEYLFTATFEHDGVETATVETGHADDVRRIIVRWGEDHGQCIGGDALQATVDRASGTFQSGLFTLRIGRREMPTPTPGVTTIQIDVPGRCGVYVFRPSRPWGLFASQEHARWLLREDFPDGTATLFAGLAIVGTVTL
jgi:hypothetical protein